MATGLSTMSLGLLKCRVPHPLFKRPLSLVGKTVVKLQPAGPRLDAPEILSRTDPLAPPEHLFSFGEVLVALQKSPTLCLSCRRESIGGSDLRPGRVSKISI